MTVTDQTTAVPTAPQPTDDEMVPAVLRDESGLYRIVNGVRLSINEPGIAVLDGTAAEAAWTALVTLEKSIESLKEQAEVQREIVKAVVGQKGVATLKGQVVLDFKYYVENRMSSSLAQALLPPRLLKAITTTGSKRSFNPKWKQHRR